MNISLSSKTKSTLLAAITIGACATATFAQTTQPSGVANGASNGAANGATNGPTIIATSEPTTQPYNRNGFQRGVTTAPGGKFQLNFQNADINNVLDELSAVAGFIVIKDVHPTGRITLQTLSNQPMSRDDVISLLNTVLKPNYAAIRQDRVLKIVDRNNAKFLNIPVHTGSDPTQVADTDELITQVIPLRQADATQLKNDLAPLINPDASFTANASSNALIITDTSSNIKRIVEIVGALDGHLVGSADVKVFSLNYASATTTAQLINDLFGAEESGNRNQQQSSPFSRMFGGGGFGGFGGFTGRFGGGGDRGGGGAQGQQGQTGQGTKQTVPVKAAADDRTNMLAVAGPTDTLNVISDVIKQLDANPAAEQTTYVYRLKNADATNMQGVLNALFNGTSYSGSSSRTNQLSSQISSSRGLTSGSGGGLGSNSSSSGRTSNSSNSTQNRSSSGYGGGSGGGGFGGSSSVSAGAQAAAAALAGQVTFIADTDTNSLVVRTAPKNYPQVQTILNELDRDRAQVLIKVLIAEVTHNSNTDLGAEFSALNLSANGNGESVGTNFGVGTLSDGLVAKFVANDFSATVHALESVGKVDVLSRPYILASDNQEANITVGQLVPYVNYSQTTDTGNTINTVNWSNIGIIVDVIPHINPDGLVLLDVAPEISSLTTSSVQVTTGVNAPVYNIRSAQSEVAVRDGQTIVIGGLMQDQKNSTITKIPVLGDIPWLGQAFQRRQDTKTKTELLIFLTPHVARQPDQLKGMSSDELKNTKLVPGAVYPGAFDEHYRGMERGSPPATQPIETK